MHCVTKKVLKMVSSIFWDFPIYCLLYFQIKLLYILHIFNLNSDRNKSVNLGETDIWKLMIILSNETDIPSWIHIGNKLDEDMKKGEECGVIK